MKGARILLSVVLGLTARLVLAQGYGGPVNFQGLEHVQLHSAAARGMAGVYSLRQPDLGSMFNQPAALGPLTSLAVSAGGLRRAERLEQEQNYAPVRYYPNLSLLLESLSFKIPDPNPEVPGFTPADTVQRPYDRIGPNWSRTDHGYKPLHLLVASPILRGGFKLVAGLGAVTYADLDYYYQNNNVLSPSILSQRPFPTLRPTDDNPLAVDWYQTVRSREGAVYAYGASLVGWVEKLHLSVGVSAAVLRGTSDDLERDLGRGKLTFFSNAFRADSVYWWVQRTGTSKFRGYDVTVGTALVAKHVGLGVSVKPPSEIRREYSGRIQTPGAGILRGADLFAGELAAGNRSVEKEDRLKLPWRGAVTMSLAPKQWLTLGFEYEFRPYGSARYVDPQGAESRPWLGSSPFRAGFEWSPRPWLSLRGGMRNEAEVFEPEGNHLPGEPVVYTAYSAGVGLRWANWRLDLAVESWERKYEDIWSSAISKNRQRVLAVLGQLSYAMGGW
ncbi:MAG: hypothetical protein ONB23_01480 [candidate division KSB1 bacterium]|nr:hypothetical protein [candidate division KSB1 bacterium]